MKKITVTISSWGELIDFVQMLDLDKQTIELVGWINSIHKNTSELKSLIFSTKEVNKNAPTNKKMANNIKRKNPKK
jgi:hypothetical protein